MAKFNPFRVPPGDEPAESHDATPDEDTRDGSRVAPVAERVSAYAGSARGDAEKASPDDLASHARAGRQEPAEPAPLDVASIGPHVAAVLSSAERAAAELLESARADAGQLRRAAEEEAATLLAAATREAEESRTELRTAQQEAEQRALSVREEADRYALAKRRESDEAATAILEEATERARRVTDAASEQARHAVEASVMRRESLIAETQQAEERLRHLVTVCRTIADQLETFLDSEDASQNGAPESLDAALFAHAGEQGAGGGELLRERAREVHAENADDEAPDRGHDVR